MKVAQRLKKKSFLCTTLWQNISLFGKNLKDFQNYTAEDHAGQSQQEGCGLRDTESN